MVAGKMAETRSYCYLIVIFFILTTKFDTFIKTVHNGSTDIPDICIQKLRHTEPYIILTIFCEIFIFIIQPQKSIRCTSTRITVLIYYRHSISTLIVTTVNETCIFKFRYLNGAHNAHESCNR